MHIQKNKIAKTFFSFRKRTNFINVLEKMKWFAENILFLFLFFTKIIKIIIPKI